MKTVYKIRCRICGIIKTEAPDKHNAVWKREFDTDTSPIDRNHIDDNLVDNIMNTSAAFKKAIQTYLEKRASEDELFAVTYKKENKSIDECCNYILECAKKGKAIGYADEEVYGWAVHYYDEDSIKDIKPTSCNVVINEPVKSVPDTSPKATKKKPVKKVEATNVLDLFSDL